MLTGHPGLAKREPPPPPDTLRPAPQVPAGLSSPGRRVATMTANSSRRRTSPRRRPVPSRWPSRLRRTATAALLQASAALARDPVIIFDLRGRIVGWNAAAEALYGYRAAEALGAPGHLLAPPDAPDDLATALDQHLRGLPPTPFEALRRTKTGQTLRVAVHLAPLRLRSGRLLAIAAQHQPRGEAPAEPSPAWQPAAERFPLALFWLDPDGSIRWANPASGALLGYPLAALLGHPIERLAVDPPRVRALLERLRAGEAVEPTELPFQTSDGQTRWLLMSASTAAPGEPILWLALDFSEFQQALERLRQSEQFYRQLVQNAPLVLWTTGPDARCLFINHRWFAFTGQSAEEAANDGWLAAIHPDDRERTVEAYLRAFEARLPYQVEYRLRRHDGVYRWVLAIGLPILEPGGVFAGYSGATLDVTELKAAQEEQTRAAIHSARIEGVLLTAREMSHLLNNSITGAIGSLELLAHDPTQERYQALIPGALEGLERAARYLRDLQNIVRVETKQTPVGEALDLQRSLG
ncbi:MAG: hypothetical protein KatS3mg061_1430 [Dehalococcoidia bacterium]|nr:MAG: hypothetical protein KatS3mg061_1430 [Dehalococcoidia bacterium]